MKTGLLSGFATWVLTWSCLLSENPAPAAMLYNYQMYPGNGIAGAVGTATLAMSNNNYTVYANFVKGGGGASFQDNLVIFIDCAPGGFTNTSPFSDKANPLEIAISGVKTSRSVANFASGFEADYAIALGVGPGSALYKLVQDDTGPHLQLVRSTLNFGPADSPNHPSYSFNFDWADIGLPSVGTNFFKFETSYITSTGSRSLESFEGLTGNPGFNTITFTNYDTYGVNPVPENANVALAVFGGIVVTVACGARVRRWRAYGRDELRAGSS